jgi:hypothetical protein
VTNTESEETPLLGVTYFQTQQQFQGP